MRSSQVTIKDIAKALSVSPSTVSRALKDHPDISPETKKAVNDLAKELNYHPNMVALGLRKNKTFTIGIIVPELVHFFFSTVVSGIEDIAYSKGYNVIICQSKESYDREVIDARALTNMRVDGLLVSISKETTIYDHFQEIIEDEIPLVLFDRVTHQLNTSKVVCDDYNGAYTAVQHLIDLGRKEIVHIAGPENLLISRERLRGYRDALEKNGIAVNKVLIMEGGEGDYQSIKDRTTEFIKSGQKFDGIFGNNDMAALGAMLAIKDVGLKIPEDVAIVGYSDWQFSSLVQPQLTTVSQSGFEMGQEAAKILIEQIESKEPMPPQIKTIKTKLIKREST